MTFPFWLGVATAASLAVLSASASEAIPSPDARMDWISPDFPNPYTAMSVIPYIMNFDHGYGDDDRTGYQFNFQPVIPFTLSDRWHLISRTIAITRFHDHVHDDEVTGSGDITTAMFFAPTKASPEGFSWGAGPIFLIPTTGDPRLGSQDWGAGLTAFGLVQHDGWLAGVLVQHLWSTGWKENAASYSRTFVQPYVSYSFGDRQSVSITIEGNYDWGAAQWTAPLNIGYAQMWDTGERLVGFYLGAKFYVQHPEAGPEVGIRAALLLGFP